ncbi:MAG: glycosyltransferase family 4 protein [Candidatus Caldarchaeum sp.]|nr:glycosyltransferase family 4 protein [Candidatus Caldarchaeum sp.]
MRVAAVIPAKGGVTGASLAVAHIMLGLLSRFRGKVDVTLVTSPEALNYPVFRRLREKGAKFALFRLSGLPSSFYWFFLGVLLLSLLRHGQFHVCHFSTPKALFYLWPFAKIVSHRIILSLEGYPPYELSDARPIQRMIGILAWRFSIELADHVAACSEWMRKVAVKDSGHAGKISTVHNPVDVERFAEAASKSNGHFRLLVVARLHRVKGVDLALRALRNLLDRNTRGVMLTIVGDGPERARLKKLARELELDEYVRFEGLRYDVEDFVKQADVVLVPSRYEPFGMVAAEAGAAGKPVVASKTGGLPEIVEDGVTGLLFETENVVMLAEKISQLLKSEEDRKFVGLNASKKIFARFSPEAAAEKMFRVYLYALRQ